MTSRALLAVIVLTLAMGAWGQTSPTGDTPVDNTAEEGPLKYGLTTRERDSVLVRCVMIDSAAAAAAAAREFRNLDVAPFLIHIFEEFEIDTSLRGSVQFWLGKTHDARGVDPLLRCLDTLLGKPALDRDNTHWLWCTIYALGFTGQDRALETLLDMATEEYWAQRGGVPRLELLDLQIGGDAAVDSLRDLALDAVAESGTERAIEAFATGKGIPPDMWRKNALCLRYAVFRNCGAEVVPWPPKEDEHMGKLVEEKTKEVERKYGIDLETLDEYWKAAQARALKEAETRAEEGKSAPQPRADGQDSGPPETDAPKRAQRQARG